MFEISLYLFGAALALVALPVGLRLRIDRHLPGGAVAMRAEASLLAGLVGIAVTGSRAPGDGVLPLASAPWDESPCPLRARGKPAPEGTGSGTAATGGTRKPRSSRHRTGRGDGIGGLHRGACSGSPCSRPCGCCARCLGPSPCGGSASTAASAWVIGEDRIPVRCRPRFGRRPATAAKPAGDPTGTRLPRTGILRPFRDLPASALRCAWQPPFSGSDWRWEADGSPAACGRPDGFRPCRAGEHRDRNQ